MVNNQTAALDRVFGSLADPTRRAIVQTLASGDRTVGELADPFAMSAPAITKHLNVLESAGIIVRQTAGRQRVCHLRPLTLRKASDWMDDYRRLWTGTLNQLDAFLAQEAEAEQ